MKIHNYWKLFVLIYLFALVVRLAIIFVFDFQFQDTNFYIIAKNLIDHGKYFASHNGYVGNEIRNGTYYAFIPPMYVFFISLFTKNHFVLSIWQSLVYSLLPLIVYLISETLFENKKIALISAVICCIYPYFVYSSNQLIDTGLACVIFGLLILSNLVYSKENNIKGIVIVGIINAIALLTRPNFLLVILTFPIYYLFTLQGKQSISAIKKYLLLFAVTLFFISPWLVRNYMVFDRFVFISTNAGYNLWLGNNELTNKYLSDEKVETIESIFSEKKDWSFSLNMNEIEKENWFKHNAINFINNNPYLFLSNSYLKFTRAWALEKPNSPLQSKWKNLIYLIFTFPLFLLSSLGLIILYKQKKRIAMLFIMLFLAYTIPFLVYFGTVRMRIPFDIMLIILSSMCIVTISNIIASIFGKTNKLDTHLFKTLIS